MKKTIFIAMMLIGMMGSAQTMSNPIIIKSEDQVKEKVWHMYENDSSVIYYSNSDMTQIKAYSTALVIKLIGKEKKPDNILYNGNSVMYEWYITDKKVIRLILNDISSLIAIREYQ